MKKRVNIQTQRSENFEYYYYIFRPSLALY